MAGEKCSRHGVVHEVGIKGADGKIHTACQGAGDLGPNDSIRHYVDGKGDVYCTDGGVVEKISGPINASLTACMADKGCEGCMVETSLKVINLTNLNRDQAAEVRRNAAKIQTEMAFS